MARTGGVMPQAAAMEAPATSLVRTALWGFTRVFSIVVLIVAWEGLARSGQFTPFVLPSLSSVIERIWTDAVSGDLAINTGLTVYRAMVGFLISMVFGILIGAAMSRNAIANWFFDPIISVGFPMPKILTGLQVALPISMIVAVVAEMLMGGYGLGGAMMTASRFADSRGVFAGIVEIAIVGYVLIKLMSVLRRRLLVWHQEANEPTTA
jgi:ABC-type nitrate/sulfonate/bicarbonate transport system permease component